MKVASVATVIVAASLMACDADAPAGPAGPGERPSFNSGVIASTTGGGHAQLPAGFSALRVSFSAVTKADGSAAGQFTQRYESAGGTVDFSGTVTCASVDAANGRAWIGGVITRNRSTNPAVMGAIHQPGRDVWFRVVDYGEGDSPDDRTTVLGFEGAAGFITSADYCAGQPWTAGDANTWALFDGNIQVRP
jgi:hypothetical protein